MKYSALKRIFDLKIFSAKKWAAFIFSVIFFILMHRPCFARSVNYPKSDSASLLTYADRSGKLVKVKTTADWNKKRQQILKNMQKAMGPLPANSNLPPFNIRITDSIREDNHIRYDIIFTAATNEDVTALLYVPLQRDTPVKLPAMLVLHETDALGKQSLTAVNPKANRAYALELAQRGYVVIAPDYPSFGAAEKYEFETDRYVSGTMKGIFNHMRCIDLLQARPDVDAARIGVIGHSLGGHNSMFVAAFDPRIKVVVSSCGWTLFDHYNLGPDAVKKYGGPLGPWAQPRYMPLIRERYKADSTLVPFDFDEVIAAIAPRPFFSSSPVGDSNFDYQGVQQGIAHVMPVYRFLNAENNLQVRYPQSEHDFPPGTRLEAYRFIDRMLQHTSTNLPLHH